METVTVNGSREPAAGTLSVQSASTIGLSTAGPARNVWRNPASSGWPFASVHDAATSIAYRRPRAKRPSALPVRKDVVLDAAGIEEQRVARVIRAPEVGLDRKKRPGFDALRGLPESDNSISLTKSTPTPFPIGAENST